MTPPTWHLFCRVVDHYGDAGIAWRLARQLCAAGDPVTLFIDEAATLDALAPSPVRDAAQVRVAAYDEHAAIAPGDVVVSIFGSGPAQSYLEAMAARDPAPLWIDYEYLSAESWVESAHLLPSPHPRLPLVKHFYYPGFATGTGGLLIEPGLADRPARLARDEGARPVRHLSMFAYADAPFDALFDAIAAGDERWVVHLPEGVGPGIPAARGSLSVVSRPFVAQEDYDRQLESCDVAFVRGEDSFVRAQVAGVPFVWQPYRQADRLHDAKRAAFEARYDAALPPSARSASRALWRAWNEPEAVAGLAPAWAAWRREHEALERHAREWRDGLLAAVPLVVRLRAWVAARRSLLLD